MSLPSEAEALREIQTLFASWTGVPEDQLAVKKSRRRVADADLVLKAGPTTFVVEYKGVSESASVARAVEQAKAYAELMGPGAVPVVAVAFMGDVGRSVCDRAGVSWINLSGNARIIAPGVRILIEGKPNRFKRRGRPSTVFAPKSSRVVRQFLQEPTKRFTQRELATATRLDEGFISRIAHKLQSDGRIERDESGSLKVVNPNILLDDWYAAYDFSKHEVLKGHIAARSTDEVVHRIGALMSKHKVHHALTGLGAAWALTAFAGFRLVTVYLREYLRAEDLDGIGFRGEERGANVWLVIPNDDGVFDGGDDNAQPMPCVHPVQVYLDLKAQPERASEASVEVRKRCLTWSAT